MSLRHKRLVMCSLDPARAYAGPEEVADPWAPSEEAGSSASPHTGVMRGSWLQDCADGMSAASPGMAASELTHQPFRHANSELKLGSVRGCATPARPKEPAFRERGLRKDNPMAEASAAEGHPADISQPRATLRPFHPQAPSPRGRY